MRGAATTNAFSGLFEGWAANGGNTPSTSTQCEQQKQSSTWGDAGWGACGVVASSTALFVLAGAPLMGAPLSLSSAHKLALVRSAAVQSRITNATARLREVCLHQRMLGV